MANEPGFIEAPAGAPTEAAAGIKSVPEIKVSDLSKATSAKLVSETPKKGSVKESIFADLRKKFGEPPPGDQKSTAKPPGQEDDTTVVSDSDDDKTPAKEGETAKASAADTKTDPKKKVSPWKVVEEQKKKVKELEDRLLEYEKKGVPPDKIKEYEDKVAASEKRRNELEEQIKYVDYTKSAEFQEKYQKPYEDYWKLAMSDLSEVTVNTGEGERPIKGNDLLELVNLPLKEAKLLADEKFGEFAPEVLGHRKEIRKMFEEQSAAIEAAKKDGAERTKKNDETQTAAMKAVHAEVMKTWTEANQSAQSDERYGHYFKEVDGDQDGNQRLAKGFEMADRAFSENPLDPRLTPEKRKEIVQRHAAVRNRAAAFGRLATQNVALQKQIAELNEKLKGYTDTEPDRAGSSAASTEKKGRGKGSAWDNLRAELAKRAK